MRKRQGFTLVELMVAMALTIFIMLILTQAFVTAIDTFVGLKGIGDMQENLRAGANALRYDLSQAHLEGDRRMSDPNLKNVPPTEGFLRVYQPTPQAAFGTTGSYIYVAEGTDLNPNGPSAARATNHVLHFASRLKGNQQQSFYSTAVTDPTNTFFTIKTMFNMDPAVNRLLPADATLTTYPAPPNAGTGIFRSQWAEIAYYLVQIGTTDEPLNTAGAGTPIYGLYRAQFVLVTDSTALNTNYKGFAAGNTMTGFIGMACNPVGNDLVFITPNDVANGTRVFDPTNPPTSVAALSSTRVGLASSLVVPNVLSFQVQGLVASSNVPQDGSYDSASSPAVIQGIYITLRVWDNKTRQTRQLSIMQDL
jgi:prepilin-type N-terminal cleavage/methylation domain-containing protein